MNDSLLQIRDFYSSTTKKGKFFFFHSTTKWCPSSHWLSLLWEWWRSLSVSQKWVWFPSEAAVDYRAVGEMLRHLHWVHLPVKCCPQRPQVTVTSFLCITLHCQIKSRNRVDWLAKGFVQEKARKSDVLSPPVFLCKGKLWLDLENNNKVLHYKGNSAGRISSLSPAVSYQLFWS